MIEHKTTMLIERGGSMVTATIAGTVEPRKTGCGFGRPWFSTEDSGGVAHVESATSAEGGTYILYDSERVIAERTLYESWECKMADLKPAVAAHLAGCDKSKALDVASVAAAVNASAEEASMVLRQLALESM